jgi:hypothetical protein
MLIGLREMTADIPANLVYCVSRCMDTIASSRVAAACCEFLCLLPRDLRGVAIPAAHFLLKSELIQSGSELASFYRLLTFTSEGDAENAEIEVDLRAARARLSLRENAILDAELCVDDSPFVAQVLALPIEEWPLEATAFREIIERRHVANYAVSDPAKLNEAQLEFARSHPLEASRHLKKAETFTWG